MGKIFDIISIPFGFLMRFCCWISPGNNYLIALIFFTIIVQALLCFLFGIKQHKNMLKQARISPMAAAIRKKYAGRDDQVTKQKMQEETMALYQENGYSPLSGCFPMLIQLPIVMVVYKVVAAPLKNMFMLTGKEINALIKGILPYCNESGENSMLTKAALDELTKGQSKLAQVEVLTLAKNGELDFLTGKAGEAADKLERLSDFFPDYNAFGLNFAMKPPYPNAPEFKEFWPLLIIPVLIVATMIISQLLTKKFTYQDPTMQQQNGCSMKVMTYTMPLFSAWIAFSFPAAVGVYWIYRSLVSTLQQFILTKIMPLPKFTEEDYKKAEKELAGTSKKNNSAKKKSGGTGVAFNSDGTVKRSLHHIDDEDYEAAVREAVPPVKEETEDDKMAPDVDPSDAPVMKEDKSNTKYKKKSK